METTENVIRPTKRKPSVIWLILGILSNIAIVILLALIDLTILNLFDGYGLVQGEAPIGWLKSLFILFCLVSLGLHFIRHNFTNWIMIPILFFMSYRFDYFLSSLLTDIVESERSGIFGFESSIALDSFASFENLAAYPLVSAVFYLLTMVYKMGIKLNRIGRGFLASAIAVAIYYMGTQLLDVFFTKNVNKLVADYYLTVSTINTIIFLTFLFLFVLSTVIYLFLYKIFSGKSITPFTKSWWMPIVVGIVLNLLIRYGASVQLITPAKYTSITLLLVIFLFHFLYYDPLLEKKVRS